ncbi:MAG TPA: signal recognition particle-docking protein FtsY [Gemmatimonadales bacterium]|nr:signal recognition particle-docking protein FtsY [Gemmatimonadales bacterium]
MAAATGVALMGLWQRIARALGAGRGAEAAFEAAERILLEADFGVSTTEELLEGLRRAPDAEREVYLERAVTDLLRGPEPTATDPGALARAAQPPTIVLLYGVNGVGKTTTVAKLAHRLAGEGRRVLLAAADTFRAGAVSQLRHWGERLGVPCVGAQDGRGDPAAVAFDAIDAALARDCDTVLVDTAGRLHTEPRLMEELKKVVRVVGKRHPGAPHESLLVLDGTVGQNAVSQAREFAAAVPLTGLVVTKLDGTARGGAVVAVRRAVPVPIRFIGTGEGLDDLEPFDPVRYARRLVSG